MTAIETPTSKNDNSDIVASLCWMKIGGSLILSSVPKNRVYGIDFNRDVPDIDDAINEWNDFFKGNETTILEDYRRR